MDSVLQSWNQFKRARKRDIALQVINMVMIVTSALIIWKTLIATTHTDSPIVVVLSGSMRPAFRRGDLLFLYHDEQVDPKVGDIIVYKLTHKPIPIVHRVLTTHTNEKNETLVLTKGDANPGDDISLYNAKERQEWIEKKHVLGTVRGFLPYVGYVTILMNDYPWLKFVIVAAMGVYTLLSHE